MWDTFIVIAIVILALAFLVRRHFRGGSSPSACHGCGGCCPTPNERERSSCEGQDNRTAIQHHKP